MIKLTKSEISAVSRVFNHVNVLCNNYWGLKSVEQAQQYASLNRWIMFPTNNLESLREGTDYPIPNIYTTFDEVISDDKNGRIEGCLGVTCGNTAAMAYIARALTRQYVSFFIDSLNTMDVKWKVSVEQKIKTLFKNNTPKYNQIEVFDAKTVTAQQIKEAIQVSDNTLLRRDDLFEDEPVIWCVTIFNVYTETIPSNFDKDIKVAFNLFKELNLIS